MNQIILQPKSSKTLLILIIILHSATALAVCFSNIALWFKFILFLCLAISAYHIYWYKILQHSKHTILNIYVNNNEWIIVDKQNKKYEATLLGDSFVSSWFIILNFRMINNLKRKSLILCRDSLGQNQFIQLKKTLLNSSPN